MVCVRTDSLLKQDLRPLDEQVTFVVSLKVSV